MNTIFNTDGSINLYEIRVNFPLIWDALSEFATMYSDNDNSIKGSEAVFEMFENKKFAHRNLYDFFDSFDMYIYPTYSEQDADWNFESHTFVSKTHLINRYHVHKKNRIEAEKQGLYEAFRELEKRLSPEGSKYKAGGE